MNEPIKVKCCFFIHFQFTKDKIQSKWFAFDFSTVEDKKKLKEQYEYIKKSKSYNKKLKI